MTSCRFPGVRTASNRGDKERPAPRTVLLKRGTGGYLRPGIPFRSTSESPTQVDVVRMHAHNTSGRRIGTDEMLCALFPCDNPQHHLRSSSESLCLFQWCEMSMIPCASVSNHTRLLFA